MKGRFMITTIVGNAQVFLVMHDCKTNRDYGVRVEISDPCLYIERTDTGFSSVGLQGKFVMQESADLDFCKSCSKERLLDESV